MHPTLTGYLRVKDYTKDGLTDWVEHFVSVVPFVNGVMSRLLEYFGVPGTVF